MGTGVKVSLNLRLHKSRAGTSLKGSLYADSCIRPSSNRPIIEQADAQFVGIFCEYRSLIQEWG